MTHARRLEETASGLCARDYQTRFDNLIQINPTGGQLC
jgi:hypothetical protein